MADAGTGNFNIMTLPPDAFMAAMDELGLPSDQREYLLGEYRRQRSPLAGVYEALSRAEAVPEGMVRNELLPVMRPEGMNAQEAYMAGKAELAVPGAVYGTLRALADALGIPGAIAAGEPVSQAAATEAAFTTAGALGLPSLAAARPEPDVARMFGGRGSRNRNAQRALDRAEELRSQGMDAESIWRRTSEEFPETPATVLPDGTPIYEISDAEMLTRDMTMERQDSLWKQVSRAESEGDVEAARLLRGEIRRLQRQMPHAGIMPESLRLVMAHENLYRDYPNLATDFTARFGADIGRPLGMFYPDVGRIEVSRAIRNQPEMEAGVLLHETQHAVARAGRSGYGADVPPGANPENLRRLLERATEPAYDQSLRLQDALDNTDKLVTRVGIARKSADAEADADILVDAVYGRIMAGTEDVSRYINSVYKDLNKKLPDAQGTPEYSLYRRDPGEALARLSSYRREMSMEERGATSPIQTLMEKEALRWDDLAKIEKASDFERIYGLSLPDIEGVPASSFAEAADIFVRQQLPLLVDEVLDELAQIPRDNYAADRRPVLAAGREKIRAAFDKAVKAYRP